MPAGERRLDQAGRGPRPPGHEPPGEGDRVERRRVRRRPRATSTSGDQPRRAPPRPRGRRQPGEGEPRPDQWGRSRGGAAGPRTRGSSPATGRRDQPRPVAEAAGEEQRARPGPASSAHARDGEQGHPARQRTGRPPKPPLERRRARPTSGTFRRLIGLHDPRTAKSSSEQAGAAGQAAADRRRVSRAAELALEGVQAGASGPDRGGSHRGDPRDAQAGRLAPVDARDGELLPVEARIEGELDPRAPPSDRDRGPEGLVPARAAKREREARGGAPGDEPSRRSAPWRARPGAVLPPVAARAHSSRPVASVRSTGAQYPKAVEHGEARRSRRRWRGRPPRRPAAGGSSAPR